MQKHEQDVASLQKEIQQWQQLKKEKPYLSLTQNQAASNTTRNGSHYKKNCHFLGLSSFNRILSVDVEKRQAIVEPKVTVEALCEACLPLSLIPPVLPEFRTITVGGAFMGTALESSSHRYGQFSDICHSVDLLLADGTLLQGVTAENDPELFHGLSGSYGTLAVIVLLVVHLIPAPTHVHLTYRHFPTASQFLSHAASVNVDFLEGMRLDKDEFVLIEGRFSPQKSLPLFDPNPRCRPWFYQHVIQAVRNCPNFEEQMTLADYLFRYDRGGFWMGAYVTRPKMILPYLTKNLLRLIKRIKSDPPNPVGSPPSFFFRALFGKLMSSQRLYKVLHQVEEQEVAELFLIQDFYLPYENAESFLEAIEKNVSLYPIWLCPIKSTKTPQFLSPHYQSTPSLINIGVYGIPQIRQSIPEATAFLEKKAFELGGRKMLYSQSYYSEEQFWEIYDRDRYDALRERCGASTAFPDIFQKISLK